MSQGLDANSLGGQDTVMACYMYLPFLIEVKRALYETWSEGYASNFAKTTARTFVLTV